MKVGKSGGAGPTGRILGTYASKAGAVRDVSTVSPVTPTAAASVLGIPEEEFTPRVRDAIMTLMGEVDRLRREVDLTRARLENVERAADQDALLPVLNRRAFVREITRFIAFAERYGTPSSLLYFDLDNFKKVNDDNGHSAGDAVLKHFVDVMSAQIRDTDVLGRLGGDEFGIILAHVTLDQATKKGASLAQSLKDKPPMWKAKPISLGFSYGAYELHAGENADSAMAQADQAMYAQKRSGRADA